MTGFCAGESLAYISEKIKKQDAPLLLAPHPCHHVGDFETTQTILCSLVCWCSAGAAIQHKIQQSYPTWCKSKLKAIQNHVMMRTFSSTPTQAASFTNQMRHSIVLRVHSTSSLVSPYTRAKTWSTGNLLVSRYTSISYFNLAAPPTRPQTLQLLCCN